jgi:hypothetical protein
VVLPLETANAELTTYMTNVVIQVGCDFTDPIRGTTAASIIRGLYDSVSISARGVVWEDVPILGPELRGTKRSHQG